MRTDPHSYADLTQARTTHVYLELRIDFSRKRLTGSATLHFETPASGPLDLDTRGIEDITAFDDQDRPVSATLDTPDPILGARLRLHLDTPTRTVTLRYHTDNASALMWLDASQTDGGQHPFVLTQCQAIHARSLCPLQDTPAARITYAADLIVPSFANAVMSAAPGNSTDLEDGTRRMHFDMPQPIPPYLLAFAAGDLDSRDLGPRCRVFAEPGVLKAAAYEFAEAEAMLTEGEALFGPYAWERYDFVVMPPSFPMGGMENPRMTFLTPTLIAGDRSLVGVLAHELAHSWTGNLVTNADNTHFWLNEGWTVWAERRILERLYGPEEANQQAILARGQLEAVIARRQAQGAPTALRYDQTGMDPDEDFSLLPYEKGFLLITALERAVGRDRFDPFVRTYIQTFSFKPITTEDFVSFVRAELPEADHVDLSAWIEEEGLPIDAPTFASERLVEVQRRALSGSSFEGETLSTTEALFVLANLPTFVDPNAVRAELNIGPTSNAELRSAWLRLATASGMKGIEDELTTFIDTVGRTKLILPVYRAMAARDDLAELARNRLEHNRARLHGSTVGAIERVL